MAFSGWPSRAIDFYAGLEADNSRNYWLAHKAVYDADVKAPFLALGDTVAREFGPLRLFRPNRDTRFAKDKSPYKTAAAAVTEGPGGTHYYVQISAEGLYVGAGYYHLMPDQLERYRAAVADDRSGPALEKVLADLQRNRYETASADALKTAPRGYPKDHPRVALLRRKGLHAGRQFAPAKWLSTKAAADRIVEVWRGTKPMNRWLDKHVGPSELPPPEPD
ncbi:MAG: DUF2461 domain-containing protein [Acidimicrobiia bacterium]